MVETGSFISEQQPIPHTEKTQFHIVSISKLAIMGILTLGLYIAYCNYRHWLHIREERGFKPIPLLCTIFGGFTMYWLMKNIVVRSIQVNQPVEGTALGVTLMWWVPSAASMIWELSTIEAHSKLSLSVMLLVPIILIAANMIFALVSLVQIQQAANACEGEPLGLQNSKITWTNVLWVIISWMPPTAVFSYVATHGPIL